MFSPQFRFVCLYYTPDSLYSQGKPVQDTTSVFAIWFFTVLNTVFASCILRHLLFSKDLSHTEADAGCIAAVLAGRLRVRCFRQIIAVLFSE